jgi:predicted ATP-grasp superfamily ATP-dependent carboligase
MANVITLNRPWLIAVWPGMGQVALNAGYYLMSSLSMRQFGKVTDEDLFDIDHIDVNNGLVDAIDRPQNRLFICDGCTSPHDIILFVGDAQPPAGKFAFCQKLISTARDLGVERVFTFAAMATQMHPEHRPRVFAAATDAEQLAELHQLEVKNLESGMIGGMNGVLLAAAMHAQLPGACLLGEIPHLFAHAPFPRATLAVLEVLTTMAKLEIDFTELTEQAQEMEQRLGEVLAQIEQAIRQQRIGEPASEEVQVEDEEQPDLSVDDHQRLEALFAAATKDRSRAYELKRELDRLEVFDVYEDRFLDLFRDKF